MFNIHVHVHKRLTQWQHGTCVKTYDKELLLQCTAWLSSHAELRYTGCLTAGVANMFHVQGWLVADLKAT